MDIYTVLLYILTFFAIMNLPISVSQPILLVITRHYRKIGFGDPVLGRKVIILIATVGKAYDVVKEIIADLNRTRCNYCIYGIRTHHRNVNIFILPYII